MDKKYFEDWIKGKQVVITGGTGGIGSALVELLLANECEILIITRNRDQESRLKSAKLHYSICDLAVIKDLDNCSRGIQEFGNVDVFIHNAALPITPCGIKEISQKEIEQTLTAANIAALNIIQTISPSMKKDSRIILTSSFAGLAGFANMPAYCASKWAMEGISKAVAQDLWKDGIMVNTAIMPATKTELSRPHYSEEQFNHFPEPNDVLEPFVYLLSTLADKMSGQTIFFEGSVNDVDRITPALAPQRISQEPIEPPTRSFLEKKFNRTDLVKVDIGEAPIGPTPKMKAGLVDFLENHHLEEYPDSTCSELRGLLAVEHGLDKNNIIVAPGSSTILSWIIELFADPSDEVIACNPCFILWKWKVISKGAQLVEFYNGGSNHNLMKVASLITPKTKLIYLDSPSNPLGDTISHSQFEWFMTRIPKHIHVVVDHAYQDFLDKNEGVDTTDKEWLKDPRIISVRTLSKSHALASFRVGYLAAHKDTVKSIMSSTIPFTVSAISQAAAKIALKDKEHSLKIKSFYISERSRIFAELDTLGITHWKGETSFISLFWPNFAEFVERANDEGIMVSEDEDPSKFVFSIRSCTDNDRIISFIKSCYPYDLVNKTMQVSQSDNILPDSLFSF